MDFELSEEQRILQDTVYKWALKEWEPLMDKADAEDWLPDDFFLKLGEMGFLGTAIDQAYGGSGQGVMSEVMVYEQLSRISPAWGMSAGASSNLCAGNINRNASDYIKEKYLPSLVSGEKIGAMGLTEPGSGSDAMSISTRAVKKGSRYILNGSKMFITNAPIADVILVYTKTEPELGPHGISAFVVEKEFPGFSASQKLDKMGMRGSPTGELHFDNCPAPAENMVGQLNGGVAVMTKGLDIERVLFAAGALGTARQALNYAIKYSKEREQFGQPIAKFQMIQAKLAEMYAQYEAARNMIYRAAALANVNMRGGKGTEITRLAAATVMFAADAASMITANAVQIHGGYGYCREFPVQRLWRDAKLYEIGAGTQEIRKLIIARELLRKGSV